MNFGTSDALHFEILKEETSDGIDGHRHKIYPVMSTHYVISTTGFGVVRDSKDYLTC